MIVVADASPLIALAKIEQLALLRELFGKLLVPQAVWREIVDAGAGRAGADELAESPWIERRSVQDVSLVHLLRQNLGAGEAEAIVLSKELDADWLIMDDRLGRNAAQRLGLSVVGLVGLLILARRRGLILDAGSLVEDLHQRAGYWLTAALKRKVQEA